MSWLDAFFKVVLIFFNRKVWKKYVLGEIDPDKTELDEMLQYLNNTQPLLIEKNASLLVFQLEQMKVPYFRDMKVDELNSLIQREIELPVIFDILIAKAGGARGVAAIVWDSDLRVYKITKNKEIIGTVAWFVLICVVVVIAYVLGGGLINNMHKIIPIIAFFSGVLFSPIHLIPTNAKDAKKNLQKNSPYIFEQNMEDCHI